MINAKQTRIIRNYYKKTKEELLEANAAIQNCAFVGNVWICASFAAHRMKSTDFLW